MKTLIILIATINVAAAQWGQPQSPAVPEADGNVEIPNAALAPRKESTYRAIFDATRAADKPGQLLPALNMAGSELNALAAVAVPVQHASGWHSGRNSLQNEVWNKQSEPESDRRNEETGRRVFRVRPIFSQRKDRPQDINTR